MWVAIAGDFHAIEAFAGDEAVAEAVAIGVVGRRVMEEEFSHAALVDRSVEQLHRVVVAEERVDDQFRFDMHRHHHRVGHVDDAEVAVGVLHADGVGSRGGIVMDGLVGIHHAVVAEVLPLDARDVFGRAVAPIDEERVALFPSRIGHVVGGQRKLVGVAAEPGVGDFGGTLVGRLGGEGEAEEERTCHSEDFEGTDTISPPSFGMTCLQNLKRIYVRSAIHSLIETANVVFFGETAKNSEKWIIFGYLDAFLWPDSQK